MDNSEIQEFYRDTSVFITGGTGFLGKLLIEKLLRSCPGIKRVYVLCRPKKGKEIFDRINELLDDQLYDLVRKADPEFKSKVVPIAGDCAEINLAIDEQDRNTLLNEVNLIFHCAATIRFDEALRTAVRINVRGTRDLLLLARGMKQLKAFVHVSTISVYHVHSILNEKLYEAPFDGDELIRLVENTDNDTLNRITPGLLGKYPNTYVYTKSIAENILKRHFKYIPIVVTRPSVVVSTLKEPLPGWCENIYGNSGVIAAMMIGLLHTLPAGSNNIANLIPADYTINASIVAAWDVARIWDRRRSIESYDGSQLENSYEIPVYNLTSFEERSITWRLMVDSIIKNTQAIPTVHAIWIPFVVMTESKYLSTICLYLFQILPLTIDVFLYCTGKRPSQIKIYGRIKRMVHVLKFFTLGQWKFGTNNMRSLYSKLNDTDKGLFNFDMTTINWEECITAFVTGVRVYILKDTLTTLTQAKQRFRFLKFINTTLMVLLSLSLYKMFNIIFN